MAGGSWSAWWRRRRAARSGDPGLTPSLQAALWRSIAVYRFASVGYAAVLLVVGRANYRRPGWAWLVVGVMLGWSLIASIRYATPALRTRALLLADLLTAVVLLLSTALLQYPASVAQAVMPVTATWVAGPVLAWAVAAGMGGGILAALVLGCADITLRHQSLATAHRGPALNGTVLLLMAGLVVGYVNRLITQAERALQLAAEMEAATRERERLARGIHDSVLQVLALVQHRGAEAGGEAAELGRLAGEQEAALRALIGAVPGAPRMPASPTGEPAGEQDLAALLAGEGSATVSVVGPADPVPLDSHRAQEVAAAVRAALDNVRRHCGEATRAWVLVEDLGEAVEVTIRDDGPGIPPGRLAAAAAAGRLGVSHAITGRARALGGSASITSSPGDGTRVLLRVPRGRPPG